MRIDYPNDRRIPSSRSIDRSIDNIESSSLRAFELLSQNVANKSINLGEMKGDPERAFAGSSPPLDRVRGQARVRASARRARYRWPSECPMGHGGR